MSEWILIKLADYEIHQCLSKILYNIHYLT